MKTDKTYIKNLELGLGLYSIHRASRLLNIGRDTLLSLIADGAIATVKIYDRQKISRQELTRFINKDNKIIPHLLNETDVSKHENKRVTKIDNSTIDKIFNKVKHKVMNNEKAQEKNIS